MMIWLAVWGWVKENWKWLWGALTVMLVLYIFVLWGDIHELSGQLQQCKEDRAAATMELTATADTVSELQAKLAVKCKGSVDLVVRPPAWAMPVSGTAWNSLMNPCPEVILKAAFDGGTEGSTSSAANASGTASVVERPGPGGPAGIPDSWALALGAGISLSDASLWHGSLALDYHRLRAYYLLDKNLASTVGVQVKLLTGNWP